MAVRFRGGSITYIFDHRRFFLYCSTYRCSITGWLLVSLDRFVLLPVKLRDWTSGRRNIEGVIVASISIVCPSVRFHSLTHSAGFRLRKCPHRVVHMQRRLLLRQTENSGNWQPTLEYREQIYLKLTPILIQSRMSSVRFLPC